MSQLFEWAFGKRLTPQEQLRKNQRSLDKAQRELQREITKLQQQGKGLQTAIKKSVKLGEPGTAKIQAKDLIRTNRQVTKFMQLKTQLQTISLRIQATRSTTAMSLSLTEATRLLNGINRTTNFPQLSKIIQEFQKENEMMDYKNEMMDDIMDDAIGDEMEDEDEEADELVNKIIDELDVDMNTKLNATPNDIKVAVAEEAGPQMQAVGGDPADDDLQARLDSLKRG
ncbi:hypothetical protein BABINDRAFT_159352 [Babjeviella inositovora NRRL Y-12698]|uniref:Uncharacterized protein n=1 Tax=Babjeviella inositovora NRRL Y-12698 TaxID=984486 RepID=A0A1E3QZ14_9ASCO|nr:uncharacterized protein BABINDRAFT_159352 [Babjeviella inositovora NRRL Y-12698]ODQ82855.1 hypothetical protein BABINDRAFT_159352 [Babjeviella inositovora NRRL Y-12698]